MKFKDLFEGSKYLFRDRPIPKEGTRTRELYDLAIAGKTIATGARYPSTLQNMTKLRDFHGFDFKKEASGVWRATGKNSASGYQRIWPHSEIKPDDAE